MIAASFSTDRTDGPIRKLDLTRDLCSVADLIELCFPLHLDPDGQTYVREMRKTAQNARLMGWLVKAPDLGTVTSSGFVWEENDRIIGNLSLISLQKDGRRVYLIANVAVHPDFRRQGIARKLTNCALSYLDRQRASQVWLQVRDDNQPAVELYRSLGFKEQAARTTWRIHPVHLKNKEITRGNALTIRRRVQEDWSIQCGWLEDAYPQTIRWNLPVNFRKFTPGLLQNLTNFIEGTSLRHWTAFLGGECAGFISWQKTDSFANNLWLAISEGKEEAVLPMGLGRIMKGLSKNHPLSIDYPRGRFEEGFKALGFEHFRTLVWMRRSLIVDR